MTSETIETEPVDYWDHLRSGGAPKPEDILSTPMWSMSQVAGYLQWTGMKLHRRVKSGTFRATRVGDRIYFTQHQFRIAIIAARVEAMAETGRIDPILLEAYPDPLGVEEDR